MVIKCGLYCTHLTDVDDALLYTNQMDEDARASVAIVTIDLDISSLDSLLGKIIPGI